MKEIQQLRRIAVRLGVSGTAIPIAETRLYKGGYGFVVLQAYVPVTQNRSSTTSPLCTVFRSTLDKFGNRKQFNQDIYNMLYTTDAEIENAKYMVFECPLPSAFTETVGELEMVFTYSEINAEDKAVSRLASGIYRTNIGDSDVSSGATVDPVGGELARLNDITIKMEQLEDSVDALLQHPDNSDADEVGTPHVVLTEDGRLKFIELKGEKGDMGELTVGKVTTVDYTEPAAVMNSGTTSDAVLDFEIPQGKPAFVKIGRVITLPPESEAKVVNVGTDNDPIFDFYIPKGDGFRISATYASITEMQEAFSTDDVPLYGFVLIDTGNVEDEDNSKLFMKCKAEYRYLTDLSGAQGIQGEAATIEIVDTVDVLDADALPSVENVGTKNAAMLKFKLPKGATVNVVEDVVQLDENEDPRVENIGNEHAALLKFYLPQGKKGDQGDPANLDEMDERYYSSDNPPPVATSENNGTVKLGSNTVQDISANAVSNADNRTYCVQCDTDGRMVVNVPWADTHVDVDYELSAESPNPISNEAVTSAIQKCVSKSGDTMTGSLTLPMLLGADSTAATGIVPVRFITRSELGLTSADGADAYIQAWLKKVCEIYPNNAPNIYIGRGDPSSQAMIIALLYETDQVDSNGMIAYATGVMLQYGLAVHHFRVSNHQYLCGTESTDGGAITLRRPSGNVTMQVSRTDTERTIGLDIGSGGTNRGLYDKTTGINKWIVYWDNDNLYLQPPNSSGMVKINDVEPYSSKNPPPTISASNDKIGGVYGYTISYADSAHTWLGYNASGQLSNNAKINQTTIIGYSAKVIGTTSNATYNNDIVIGYGASVTNVSNTIQMGNSSISSFKCKVSVSTTSDERDKTDIVDLDSGLALKFITELDPIQYVDNDRDKYLLRETKIDEETGETVFDENGKNNQDYASYGMCEYDRDAHMRGDKKGERKRIGVRAQQVQQALLDIYGSDNYANLVNDDLYDRRAGGEQIPVENRLSVSYERFVPFLIGAVKAQQKQIEELLKRVRSLEAK